MTRIPVAFDAFFRSSFVLWVAMQLLAPTITAGQEAESGLKPIWDTHWHGSAAPHEIVSGIWRVDHTFQSTIRIKNVVENASLSVTPVLFMADGTEYDLPKLQLDPGGVAMVNVNDALDSAPAPIRSHASEFGSVSLRYTWYWAAAIVGQIENLDVRRSLVYVHPFGSISTKPQEPQQQQIEGMWWKRDAGVGGFVALTNVSSSVVQAKISVDDAPGQSVSRRAVSLAAHTTQMINLPDFFAALPNGTTEGGVHIVYTGTSDGLVVVGGLENVGEGYSARLPLTMAHPQSVPQTPASVNPGSPPKVVGSMSMAQPGPKQSSTSTLVTVAGVGIMVGAPDPMMMFPATTRFAPYATVHNTTNQNLKLSPTVYYMDGGAAKDAPLSPVVLGPHETRQLPLQQMLLAAGLGNFSGEINAAFSFTGDYGDLLLAQGSVDQTGNYVFEVAPAALASSTSKSLSYWNAADGTDTMFSIWNHGNADEDLVITLFYKGGSYKYPVHLGAKASAMFNISEIIQAHKLDADGTAIPFFIRQGSAKISGPNGDMDTINATVGISTFNVRTKTCTVRCVDCNGATEFSFTPNPLSGTNGTSVQLTATAQYNTGAKYDVTKQSSWNSNNTPVATVSSGLVQLVAPGAATIMAQDRFTVPTQVCSEVAPPPCPTVDLQTQGPGEVGPPQIQSISPSSGLVGTGTAVTIMGAGFTGATVSPAQGTNIAVSNVTVQSDSEITATLTPTNSISGGGNQAITVTANGLTASTNFFGQVPSHFVPFNQPLLGAPNGLGPVTPITNGSVLNLAGQVVNGPSGPLTNQCGVYENLLYQLTDQSNDPVSDGAVTVVEVFSNVKGGSGPNPSTNVITLPNQGENDTQSLTHAAPSCLATNENESLDMTWTAQVGTVVYSLQTVVHITKGNFNGTLNVTATITTP